MQIISIFDDSELLIHFCDSVQHSSLSSFFPFISLYHPIKSLWKTFQRYLNSFRERCKSGAFYNYKVAHAIDRLNSKYRIVFHSFIRHRCVCVFVTDISVHEFIINMIILQWNWFALLPSFQHFIYICIIWMAACICWDFSFNRILISILHRTVGRRKFVEKKYVPVLSFVDIDFKFEFSYQSNKKKTKLLCMNDFLIVSVCAFDDGDIYCEP